MLLLLYCSVVEYLFIDSLFIWATFPVYSVELVAAAFLTPWIFEGYKSLPTIFRRFDVKLNCKLFFAVEKIPEYGEFSNHGLLE